MGYAEAIEQQMAALRFWSSNEGAEALGHNFAQFEQDSRFRNMQGELEDCLRQAEPYYVSPLICTLLEQGRQTFPDSTLLESLLPSPAGYVWFGAGLDMPCPVAVNPEDDMPPCGPLVAIAWKRTWWRSTSGDDEQIQGIAIYWFHRQAAWGSTPCLRGQAVWPFGDNLNGWHTTNRSRPSAIGQSMTRAQNVYLMELLSFLNQRILTIASTRILNRGARRRVERVFPHTPTIRVVELRQREYQQRDESHDRQAEWSCRWLVRGHWHQYHTKEGLQPRWVAPYIKGPDDKPLKAPTITAYEVVR